MGGRRVSGSFASLRMTAGTDKSKSGKQEQPTTTAKYRDLSTARRTMMPSVASVEMTFSLCGCDAEINVGRCRRLHRAAQRLAAAGGGYGVGGVGAGPGDVGGGAVG